MDESSERWHGLPSPFAAAASVDAGWDRWWTENEDAAAGVEPRQLKPQRVRGRMQQLQQQQQQQLTTAGRAAAVGDSPLEKANSTRGDAHARSMQGGGKQRRPAAMWRSRSANLADSRELKDIIRTASGDVSPEIRSEGDRNESGGDQPATGRGDDDDNEGYNDVESERGGRNEGEGGWSKAAKRKAAGMWSHASGNSNGASSVVDALDNGHQPNVSEGPSRARPDESSYLADWLRASRRRGNDGRRADDGDDDGGVVDYDRDNGDASGSSGRARTRKLPTASSRESLSGLSRRSSGIGGLGRERSSLALEIETLRVSVGGGDVSKKDSDSNPNSNRNPRSMLGMSSSMKLLSSGGGELGGLASRRQTPLDLKPPTKASISRSTSLKRLASAEMRTESLRRAAGRNLVDDGSGGLGCAIRPSSSSPSLAGARWKRSNSARPRPEDFYDGDVGDGGRRKRAPPPIDGLDANRGEVVALGRTLSAGLTHRIGVPTGGGALVRQRSAAAAMMARAVGGAGPSRSSSSERSDASDDTSGSGGPREGAIQAAAIARQASGLDRNTVEQLQRKNSALDRFALDQSSKKGRIFEDSLNGTSPEEEESEDRLAGKTDDNDMDIKGHIVVDMQKHGEDVKSQLRQLSEKRTAAPGVSKGKPPTGKPPRNPQALYTGTSTKETKEPEKKPLSVWEIIFHWLSLIVTDYPVRAHRRWKRKMQRLGTVPKPEKNLPANKKEVEDDFSDTETVGSLMTDYQRTGFGKYTYDVNEFYTIKPKPPPPQSGLPPRNGKRTAQQRGLWTSGEESAFEAQLGWLPKRPTATTQSTEFVPRLRHDEKRAAVAEERSHRGRHRSRDSMGIPASPAYGRTHRRGASSWLISLGNRFASLGGRFDRESKANDGGAGVFSPRGRNHPNKIRLRRRKTRLARLWDQIRHPLASLRRKYRRSKRKTRLLASINKHDTGEFDGLWDRIRTEVFLWGQWVFELLTPPRVNGRRRLPFTTSLPFVLLVVFFFMAGEYPHWRSSNSTAAVGPLSSLAPLDRRDDGFDFGPDELLDWVLKNDDSRNFDSDFLILWGARYLPRVASGESRRWFQSLLIHESFSHVASNVALFVVLSWGIEAKYGSLRTLAVCGLSGVAGNFVSAAGEDPCALVVGASGCVFGLAGFFIADVVVDFKRVSFPVLKLLGVGMFLSAFAVALATQEETSHLSHGGGFLTGLGLSLVLIHKFMDERLEAALPWVALATLTIMFVVFPIFVYENVLSDIRCSE